MMRKDIVFLMAAAAVLASCNKEAAPVAAPQPAEGLQEIVLGVDGEGLDLSVDTKTTAVSAVPGTLYWGATTGTSTEAAKWASASATVSSSKISTGKYQTATPTAYNYYVSNVNMSVGANTTVSASNTTDVICGRAASTNSATPSVTLNHVFARTGTISATTSSGTLTNVSYKLVSKGSNTGTAGTYNLKSGAWSSTTALAATTVTGSSDLYLIPGTYTLQVTATYTRGDYTTGSVTKSGDITLTAGKINNIAVTWPTAGTQIVISVSLTAWSSQNVSVTVS